jgi:putative flippase GtrA
MPKLMDRLPAPVANRLRTRSGTQFVRFALVAVVSLGASEIALALFIGPMHMTGGVSGVSAAVVGAIVSYFLSRRAWGRKGRPNVVRETIPFWLVSVAAWVVLGLATKLGLLITHSLHLHHIERHLVVGGVYFIANCMTFLARFLILHYVLFADRGDKADQVKAVGIESESLSPVTVPASSLHPDNAHR